MSDHSAPALGWRRRDTVVLAVLVVVAAALYLTYSLVRHAEHFTAGYDLGLFDQGIRGYAHFRAPVADIKWPGFNLMGDHFHPVLALLAPLYWVWDDPRVLLVVQVLVVVSSAIPVYKMARARLDTLTSALLTFGYLFGWPVQSMMRFDFHEIAFGLPLLAWTLYLVDRRRYTAALAVAAALLLVREDMGLVLVALALVLLLRRERLRAGIAAALGIAGYYVATGLVIPAIARPGLGYQYWSYDALGPDLPSALRFVVTHPVSTLRIFFHPPKYATFLLLLFQSGFPSIASPYFLLAVPVLSELFLSSRRNLWGPRFHYWAPIAVILAMALVDVLGRVRWRAVHVGTASYVVALAVMGTATAPVIYPLGNLPRLLSGLDSPRLKASRAALRVVPHGVCVEASNRLAPQFTPYDDVTLPARSLGVASWLVLDMEHYELTEFPDPTPAPYLSLERAIDTGFEVVAVGGSTIVLHRPGTDATTCEGP